MANGWPKYCAGTPRLSHEHVRPRGTRSQGPAQKGSAPRPGPLQAGGHAVVASGVLLMLRPCYLSHKRSCTKLSSTPSGSGRPAMTIEGKEMKCMSAVGGLLQACFWHQRIQKLRLLLHQGETRPALMKATPKIHSTQKRPRAVLSDHRDQGAWPLLAPPGVLGAPPPSELLPPSYPAARSSLRWIFLASRLTSAGDRPKGLASASAMAVAQRGERTLVGACSSAWEAGRLRARGAATARTGCGAWAASRALCRSCGGCCGC